MPHVHCHLDAFLFSRAAADAGLEKLSLVPRQLRHKGGSHDAFTHRKNALVIQMRGRWASADGPGLYCEPARLNQMLVQTTPSQHQEAQ